MTAKLAVYLMASILGVCVFSFFPSQLRADDEAGKSKVPEPRELKSLRENYEAALGTKVGPLLENYVEAIKRLEKELVDDGELEKALAVREYRVKVALERGEGKGSAPAEVADLAAVFEKSREARAAPLRKIYVQELEKLERRLSSDGRLRDAIEVKRVRVAMVPPPKVKDPPAALPPKPQVLGDRAEQIRSESVIWWDFEGPSKRSAEDRSPAKNDASLGGVKKVDDPERGRVASFRVPSDMIRVDSIKKFEPESLSFSMWIKGGHAKSSLFSYATPKQSNEMLVIFDNGLKIFKGVKILHSTKVQPEAEWRHVVAVYDADSGQTAVYIDGKAEIDQKLAKIPVVGGGILVIGQDQDGFGTGMDPKQSFIGLMDDIIVIPRALSRSEVIELYRSQRRR